MNNIYLVGFMGAGKTSVGKELSRRLKRQFVDLDDLIELEEKCAIRDIFAKKGERYFRKAEKNVLKKASAEKEFIVACGGGIIMDEENIKTMKKTGLMICLSASPEAIIKRTSGCAHRPLLNVSDPKKQIELLLKLRSPYYAQADKSIDTSNLSIKQAADRIAKLVLKKKNKK